MLFFGHMYEATIENFNVRTKWNLEYFTKPFD